MQSQCPEPILQPPPSAVPQPIVPHEKDASTPRSSPGGASTLPNTSLFDQGKAKCVNPPNSSSKGKMASTLESKKKGKNVELGEGSTWITLKKTVKARPRFFSRNYVPLVVHSAAQKLLPCHDNRTLADAWNKVVHSYTDAMISAATPSSAAFTLSEGGPDKAIVELYAKVAKHPAAQIIAQDFFLSGLVKSATDFQVYKEVANLSGLDFAFMQNVAVYHTKNDKIELLTPGSLQHAGDNILALLLEASVSEKLPLFGSEKSTSGPSLKMDSVFFDILARIDTALYRFASSSVTIGGHVSCTFQLSRSVRQGPLAPYLFLFVAKTMSDFIRAQQPVLRGLIMPVADEPDLIDQEYAADTLLFLHYSLDVLDTIRYALEGMFIVTYSQSFAKQLYVSIIAQSLLLLFMSLRQGGWTAVKCLALSAQCAILSWVFSLSLSFVTSLSLTYVCNTAIPYIAHPWLAGILFGMPSLFGALVGHHLGFKILKSYIVKVRQLRAESLRQSVKKTDLRLTDLQQVSKETDLRLAVWDTERWLFKIAFMQWIVLLALGTWFEVGASYIAMLWVVSPALAYGLIDATFSPQRAPRELRTLTLLVALPIPLIASAGSTVNFFSFIVGSLVRFDRNPGMNPDWLGNSTVAILTAAIVCLSLMFLFPYAHRSGNIAREWIHGLLNKAITEGLPADWQRNWIKALFKKGDANQPTNYRTIMHGQTSGKCRGTGGLKWILGGIMFLFTIAFSLVALEVFPPFTEHTGRAVNVVHVIEIGSSNGVQMPTSSYISLSSLTPGKLTQELAFIKEEGFACEKGVPIDMVTHVINYGCTSFTGQDWEENHLSEHPTLELEEEREVKGERLATFQLNVQAARRWVMAINTTSLESFQLDAIKGASGEKEVLASRQAPESVDGWHVIQFVTDQDGPSSFELSLSWSNLTSLSWQSGLRETWHKSALLKLRTDVNKTTFKLRRTLEKLPSWVSLFGKSTSPYPLAYLITFPAVEKIASSNS
ncbi:hypothetical protein L7F22_025319 [Adiantum nelumboides]|nr:hypothetical protein [Adiantum nelumboides]